MCRKLNNLEHIISYNFLCGTKIVIKYSTYSKSKKKSKKHLILNRLDNTP